MPEIEVFVCDREGTRFGTLTGATVDSLMWELNEPGTATISLDPKSPGATEIALVDREIQVWFDDVLVWWGVPWNYQGDSGKVTLSCEGLLSYFTKRYIDRTSLIYGNPDPLVTVDQFAIGWNLVAYAQDESVQGNRDLNILSSSWTPSGVGRTAVYPREDHAMILDLLREFPKMNNGFDFEIVATQDGARFWTPHYPVQGTAKLDYALQFDDEGDRNVANFTYQEDAVPMITQAYVTGGTIENEKIEEQYELLTASVQHGVMQGVISEGTSVDYTFLHDRAVKEVNLRNMPVKRPSITGVRVTSFDFFGHVFPGDWIPVTIHAGLIDVDAMYRIQSLAWQPNNTVVLTFAEEVAA